MKKKAYINPTMRVVVLKHRSHLLAGSNLRVRNVSSTEGFTLSEEDFDDDVVDM